MLIEGLLGAWHSSSYRGEATTLADPTLQSGRQKRVVEVVHVGQNSGISKKIKKEKWFGVGCKNWEAATPSLGLAIPKVWKKPLPYGRDAQESRSPRESKTLARSRRWSTYLEKRSEVQGVQGVLLMKDVIYKARDLEVFRNKEGRETGPTLSCWTTQENKTLVCVCSLVSSNLASVKEI